MTTHTETDHSRIEADAKPTAPASLVFLDLDGTLWNPEGVPASALEAIEKARANGHLIFANTGRSKDGARRSLKGIPLSGAVFSAGTEIWMEDGCLFYHPFPADLAHKTIDAIRDLDVGFSVEGSESTFSNRKAKDFLYRLLSGAADRSYYVHVPDPDEMKDEDFESVMKFSIHEMKPGALDDFLDEHDLVITPFSVQESPTLFSGEVTQKAMSKGSAFGSIIKALGKPYRTIAIGDSANDLPMFACADLAIAMGNATDEAKEAANWVTTPVDQDGLYNAFVHAGLI